MTHIFEWKCSFYSGRTWKYGKLKLYQQTLKFKENAKTEGQKLIINTCDIIEVKRRTTSLLFNAITIKNTSKDVFWFSSFENVYNVLSIIEHFWRDSLLGNSPNAKSSLAQGRSQNELLEIVYDSQSTLMSAGRTLHSQGEQITSACKQMDLLHSDLRIGEKIVSDLESWFGSWNVKTPNPVSIASRQESPLLSQRLEYAVLIAKTAQESHSSAVLVIGTTNVEIFGEKNKLLYSFPIAELSYANVHSPYDMTFEKRSIGKPDVKVHVISTRLPFILKSFESLKYKPVYEDLPTSSSDDENCKDGFATKRRESDFDKNVVKPTLEYFGKTENQQSRATKPISSSEVFWENKTTMPQQLKQRSKKQLSDEDANEIASVLRNVKAMAIDIKQEQDLQNDQLDRLTQSVQKADMKIREDNRIIKKML